MSEIQLAHLARDWLRARGAEVFAEVMFRSHRIDLVGLLPNGDLIAVEVKRTCGLPVLEQAWRWRDYTNETWVAIPSWRRKSSGTFAREVCLRFEIGLLALDTRDGSIRFGAGRYASTTWKPQHSEIVAAPRHDLKGRTSLLKALYPEQKESEAGGNGGHSTPFRRTAAALVETVRKRPGITLRDAVKLIPNHYSTPASARQALYKMMRRTSGRPVELELLRLDASRPARLWFVPNLDKKKS